MNLTKASSDVAAYVSVNAVRKIRSVQPGNATAVGAFSTSVTPEASVETVPKSTKIF